MKKLVVAVITAMGISSVQAGELEAAVVSQGDFSGFTFDYTHQIKDNTYVVATFDTLSADETVFGTKVDANYSMFSAAYGMTGELNKDFDWFGQAGLALLSAEVSSGGFKATDDKTEIVFKAGVTSSYGDKFDYSAYVAMEDDTFLGLKGNYKVNDQFGIVASFETFDGDSRLSGGVSYKF